LKYVAFGFVFVQDAVERALVDMNTQANGTSIGVYAQQAPSPCASQDL
jgi:hypothetical protein